MKTFYDDIQFLGRVAFATLPDSPVGNLVSSVPNVENGRVLKCSGLVINITDFVGGSDGNSIKLKGDGTTTIVHGTGIKTNTGANKLLTLNIMYTFTYILADRCWYEDE